MTSMVDYFTDGTHHQWFKIMAHQITSKGKNFKWHISILKLKYVLTFIFLNLVPLCKQVKL